MNDTGTSVDALLALHDEAFVRGAFNALLQRQPNAEELGRNVDALRSARLNKIDLLQALAESSEGRAIAADIMGLAQKMSRNRLKHLVLERVPGVRRVAKWAFAVAALPRLNATLDALMLGFGAYATEHDKAEQQAFTELLVTCRAELATIAAGTTSSLSAYDAELSQKIAALEARVERLRTAMAAPSPQVLAEAAAALWPILDDVLDAAKAETIVHLGPAAGAWLQVLGDRGFRARAVAPQHLQTLPAQSVAAVTAIHALEAQDDATMATILAAIHHVLRPGGVLFIAGRSAAEPVERAGFVRVKASAGALVGYR